jgi:hypothetical protein
MTLEILGFGTINSSGYFDIPEHVFEILFQEFNIDLDWSVYLPFSVPVLSRGNAHQNLFKDCGSSRPRTKGSPTIRLPDRAITYVKYGSHYRRSGNDGNRASDNPRVYFVGKEEWLVEDEFVYLFTPMDIIEASSFATDIKQQREQILESTDERDLNARIWNNETEDLIHYAFWNDAGYTSGEHVREIDLDLPRLR